MFFHCCTQQEKHRRLDRGIKAKEEFRFAQGGACAVHAKVAVPAQDMTQARDIFSAPPRSLTIKRAPKRICHECRDYDRHASFDS